MFECLRLEETNKPIKNQFLNIARLIFFVPAGIVAGLLGGVLSILFFKLIFSASGTLPFGLSLPVVIVNSIAHFFGNLSTFWICAIVADFLRPTFINLKTFKIIFAFLAGLLVVGTIPAFTTTEISDTKLWIEMIAPILAYFGWVFPMKKPFYDMKS